MGNCGSGSRKSKPEEIVDLERIVLEIARQRFSTGDLTFAEKLCLEKSVYLEVSLSITRYVCPFNNTGLILTLNGCPLDTFQGFQFGQNLSPRNVKRVAILWHTDKTNNYKNLYIIYS